MIEDPQILEVNQKKYIESEQQNEFLEILFDCSSQFDIEYTYKLLKKAYIEVVLQEEQNEVANFMFSLSKIQKFEQGFTQQYLEGKDLREWNNLNKKTYFLDLNVQFYQNQLEVLNQEEIKLNQKLDFKTFLLNK